MINPVQYELLFLVLSFFCFWAMSWIGGSFRKRNQKLEGEDREEFLFILGGALTLLGLIIGFTFSMAVSRYDLRKQYEEQEANTIGTEYSRVDLLPAADASKVHALLRSYLDQRILHYETPSSGRLEQIDARTERLQRDLWSGVAAPAAANGSPVNTLVLAGMNEAIDSQGYAQAASWNRVPIAAWGLLTILSMFCNFLVGYSLPEKRALLSLILPVAVSVSLILIADIDSPRRGLIRVRPQNLESLADSLRRAEGHVDGAGSRQDPRNLGMAAPRIATPTSPTTGGTASAKAGSLLLKECGFGRGLLRVLADDANFFSVEAREPLCRKK